MLFVHSPLIVVSFIHFLKDKACSVQFVRMFLIQTAAASSLSNANPCDDCEASKCSSFSIFWSHFEHHCRFAIQGYFRLCSHDTCHVFHHFFAKKRLAKVSFLVCRNYVHLCIRVEDV